MNSPRSTARRFDVFAEAQAFYYVGARKNARLTDESVADLRKQLAAYQERLGEHAEPERAWSLRRLLAWRSRA
jgi:hypothetical protein